VSAKNSGIEHVNFELQTQNYSTSSSLCEFS